MIRIISHGKRKENNLPSEFNKVSVQNSEKVNDYDINLKMIGRYNSQNSITTNMSERKCFISRMQCFMRSSQFLCLLASFLSSLKSEHAILYSTFLLLSLSFVWNAFFLFFIFSLFILMPSVF